MTLFNILVIIFGCVLLGSFTVILLCGAIFCVKELISDIKDES